MGVLATEFFSSTTVQFLLIGMATGALYALIALGIVLVHRASGVLNFSAGAFAGVAAYFFYTMRDEHHLPWLPMLVLAVLLGAVLGALTQVLVMGALRRTSLLVKLIATLGLLAAAQGAIAVIWGPGSKGFPTSVLPVNIVHITDTLTIPKDRLVMIALAIVLAMVLRVVYSKTLFGLATSAVAESGRVASTSGWSPTLIELANFMLAGALSAVAGILLTPVIGLSPASVTLLVLPALAAALVGRFSSFAVTVGAALALGMLGAETGLFRPDLSQFLGWQVQALSGLPDVVPLLIIVVGTTLSGKALLQRGESLAVLPLPGTGRVRPILLAIGVVIGVVLLFGLPRDWADTLVVTFASAVLILSVVVVTGYCGQLSLCQYALAGFGAWAAGRLVATQGVPFELALVLGIIATVPVGVLVALPALRTRGVNLAVATLALALMISAVVLNNGSLTGGFTGTVVPSPKVFGIDLDPIRHPERYGTFALVMLVGAGLVVANVRRGRSGRRMLAVRSNERAAASLGVGVYGAKLYAFALASGIAALAGILLGFRHEHIQFQQFDVFGSITVVLNSVIGGLGWASGSIIGAMQGGGGLNSKILNELIGGVDTIQFWLVVLSGVGVVGILRQSPDGLAAMFSRSIGRAIPDGPRRPMALEAAGIPMRTRPPAEVELRGITVRFGGVIALQDVSFSIRPGEVLGLIGPNGAGKTTVLDVVTGFTGQAAGSVLVNGETVDGWSPQRRARAGVLRSWQSVELFEEMTVLENLLVAADTQDPRRYFTDLVRPGRPCLTPLIEETIAEFELGPHLDARPSSLSQGTARLVAIARAIIATPAVLLLDEPAAGLDSNESAELGRVIRRVVETLGIGVMLVEHDMALLMSTCDRVVVLESGRTIADGTPDDIARDPVVLRAYLGTASGGDDRPVEPGRTASGPEFGGVLAEPGSSLL